MWHLINPSSLADESVSKSSNQYQTRVNNFPFCVIMAYLLQVDKFMSTST